jgi:hypothetical protein
VGKASLVKRHRNRFPPGNPDRLKSLANALLKRYEQCG